MSYDRDGCPEGLVQPTTDDLRKTTGMTNEQRARKWLTEEGCFCPIAIPADEDTVTSLAALLDEVRAEVLREVIASEAPPLRPSSQDTTEK